MYCIAASQFLGVMSAFIFYLRPFFQWQQKLTHTPLCTGGHGRESDNHYLPPYIGDHSSVSVYPPLITNADAPLSLPRPALYLYRDP